MAFLDLTLWAPEGDGVLVNVDQVTTIRADGHSGTLVVAGGDLLHVAEEYSTVRQMVTDAAGMLVTAPPYTPEEA